MSRKRQSSLMPAMPNYASLVMDASYGAGRLTCFLCNQTLSTGDLCRCVPDGCADTIKWRDGQAYEFRMAHDRCIRQAFGEHP